MRRYEMMVILTDDLDEDAARAAVERIRGTIGDLGGEVLDESWWGKRKFTYEINHRSYGWYHVFDFTLTDEGRIELERQLKIADDVVRIKVLRPELHVHRTRTASPATA